MATYVRAGLPEVAAALATLTGEPHPLAARTPLSGVAGSGAARGAAKKVLRTGAPLLLLLGEPGDGSRGYGADLACRGQAGCTCHLQGHERAALLGQDQCLGDRYAGMGGDGRRP